MTKSKRKRKAKTKRKTESGLEKWVANLFEPVPIDFVAQIPREDCIARPESLRKDRWWHSPKIYVTIMPIDDATYAFHFSRTHSTINFIEADGYLQYWAGNQTCISGEVSSQSKIFAGAPFVLIVIAVLYFVSPADARCLTLFAGWWLLATVIDIFIYRHLRHELAKMIKTTLGY